MLTKDTEELYQKKYKTLVMLKKTHVSGENTKLVDLKTHYILRMSTLPKLVYWFINLCVKHNKLLLRLNFKKQKANNSK
jgi:hypothetical protein